jgi:hypothetical protein
VVSNKKPVGNLSWEFLATVFFTLSAVFLHISIWANLISRKNQDSEDPEYLNAIRSNNEGFNQNYVCPISVSKNAPKNYSSDRKNDESSENETSDHSSTYCEIYT